MDSVIGQPYFKTVMNNESMLSEPAVYFDAKLRPHRSLNKTGFAILILSTSGLGFAIGISFLIAGAWPVLGFCGLELLLLCIAFRLNYRSGCEFEHIRLTDAGLQIYRYGPGGKTGCENIEPSWLRVAVSETPPDKGHLILSSHGRSIKICEFLPIADRLEVAAALRDAIKHYRAPTH